MKKLLLLIAALFVLVPSLSFAVPRQTTITFTYVTNSIDTVEKFDIFYSAEEGLYPSDPQHTVNKEDFNVTGTDSGNTIIEVSTQIEVDYETDYWFVMTASTESETSVYSPAYMISIPEAEVIVEPILCREKIPLAWNMVDDTGIGGYKVHYKLVVEGEVNQWTTIDVGMDTHYLLGSDDSLPPIEAGKKYGVSVTAYDTIGNHSDHSEIQACLIGKPPIPILTVLEEIPSDWL